MIQFIAGAAGAGLVLGSLGAWYLTAEYKDATWSAATNHIKVEAAEQLQAATMEALEVEREASLKVRELEAQHVKEEKDLAVIERRNRQLARELGGLRDPGRRPSSADAVSGAPASPSSAERATPTGQLSAEASEVLLTAAPEADSIAEYARVCYEWKEVVTKLFAQKEEE